MKTLSAEELRISLGKHIWGYDDLTDAEKKALLNRKERADHPQPIDYGLTRDDLDIDTEGRIYRLPDGLRYKEGPRWFGRFIARYQRKQRKPNVLAFNKALQLHHLCEIATYEAAQDQLTLTRSYWEGLNGYQFEVATAEVLKKHQFNPTVTRGSADGGVDIEVTRRSEGNCPMQGSRCMCRASCSS